MSDSSLATQIYRFGVKDKDENTISTPIQYTEPVFYWLKNHLLLACTAKLLLNEGLKFLLHLPDRQWYAPLLLLKSNFLR